jgi:uncharacterized membrane protein YhhN
VSVGLSGLALFWLGYAAGLPWLRLAAKPVPVLALAVFALGRGGPAAGPIALGLAVGAAGDVLLEAGHFLPGLVAFLIGHVAYIAGFVRLERALAAPLALPATGFVGLMIALLWPSLGAMRLPVVAYALVIGAMMWRAAARARSDDPRALVGLVGAIVFALSDALIALNKFRAPIEGVRVPILLTYWTAQTLVAASLPPRDAGSAAPATPT